MKSKILLFITLTLVLLPIADLNAQTEVRRYYANDDNNYGIVYDLPKTLLEVSLTIEESKYTPGYLVDYAPLYLGREASKNATTDYKILSASVRDVGIPDTTKRFLVIFDKNTVAPFVSLTDFGIIANINGRDSICSNEKIKDTYTPWTKLDKELPAMPQTYQLATTKAKQASIVAEYLSHIKQSIMDIVTGDVEQMPKDGESMKIVMNRLNLEEARAKRLFLGDTIYREQNVRVYIEPTADDINNRTVVRFSPIYGIVSDIDLSGEPIKLDVKVLDKAPEMTKEQERRFRRKLDGIAYNIPARADVTLRYGDSILCNTTLPITQGGSMQILGEEMFNVKNKKPIEVYFDINSGAIAKITQQ